MLQFFTEYGKLLKTEDGDKAFQELMFLIRDWQYDYEAPFGRSGGQQVLENNLKVSIVLRSKHLECFQQ